MSNAPSPAPPSDRRPIRSRNLAIFQFIAQKLAAAHVSANLISILGMVVAFLGAMALYFTNAHRAEWFHYLLAAACIQFRLLANMLDGMVAIASGKASSAGELFNEIPDRLSDTALLVAAGYAVNSVPALGWAAATAALFVTYIRAVGKSMGVPGLFHGPMSKSHRMFTLTLACVYLALTPSGWQSFTVSGVTIHIMPLALALIVLGTIFTAFRRLTRISRALKQHPSS